MQFFSSSSSTPPTLWSREKSLYFIIFILQHLLEFTSATFLLYMCYTRMAISWHDRCETKFWIWHRDDFMDVKYFGRFLMQEKRIRTRVKHLVKYVGTALEKNIYVIKIQPTINGINRRSC